MRGVFLPLLALPFALVSAQQSQLLPDNLPACAKGCTVLQQGATGCLPAGGAPQAGQGTYQSCFCQSALLTQLYAPNAVQLCSSCQSQDMATIQNWYKNFCGKGGSPLPGGNQNGNQGTTTTTAKDNPTQSASSKSSQSNDDSTSTGTNGSWISTHWKWILMLIIIIIGLVGFAFAFIYFHRRYHARRMNKWSNATSSHPNINNWGPGQSVHDLGWAAGREQEKGKTREQVNSVQQPAPTRGGHRDREKPRRFSGRLF